MSEGMVKSAVQTMRENIASRAPLPQGYVPSEPYPKLFNMLEVWGSDTDDREVHEKAKFIYEALKGEGEPLEKLVSLFTELGATPVGDTKLNRVYRYLKLKNEAKKVMQHFDVLAGEMNSLKKDDKSEE
jgi:hypothetical protein